MPFPVLKPLLVSAAVLIAGLLGLTLVSDSGSRGGKSQTGIDDDSEVPIRGAIVGGACCSPAGRPILYVTDPLGSHLEQLPIGALGGYFPAWAPDGSSIAFTASSGGATGTDIYLLKMEGFQVVQLTDRVGTESAPSWSPDGTQLAFEGSTKGSTSIFVMKADGSLVRQVTSGLGADHAPTWLGRTEIAFNRNLSSNVDLLYSIRSDGTRLTRLTAGRSDLQPVAARTGEKVAFLRKGEKSNSYDVYVLDVPTEGIQRITKGPGDEASLAWSPDGSQIVVCRSGGGDKPPMARTFSLQLLRVEGGSPQHVLTVEHAPCLGLTWKPN